MSSVELARRLGTRQPTAWLIKHKLMAAMAAREAEKPKLAGRVEVDDAYLGGQRSGGKRGRGAAGKTPFVAAVETTAERKPRRLRLTVVKGFRKKEIASAGQARPRRRQQRGQRRPVLLDGGQAAGCDHFPMVTGSGPQAAKWVAASPGSTPRSATSRRRSPAPTITSAPSTPSATSPASPGACMGLRVSSFECRHRVPSCVEFISVAAAQPRFGARRSEGSSPSGADHRATSLYPADP